MDLRIVSTYNPANWSAFVQRNVKSWLEHIDAEFVIYHEGDRPPLERDRIVWRQWEDIPGAAEFVAEAAAFPAACGRFGQRYDYNYDAHKFCRKVYAQTDAAAEDGDLLLWLDSDVEATRGLPVTVLEDLLLGGEMATYCRPGFHSESGIVLWDLRGPHAHEFWGAYRGLYDSRRIYCLEKGWHDCWAMDFVCKQLGIEVVNLTTRTNDFGTAQLQELHVVPDSVLGHYLRHDKGALKHAAA